MNALDELKSIPHWVGFIQPSKKPMNAMTGYGAKSNDPSTWTDVNTAWRAKKKYGWAGIGYVFTIKTGIVGVDLDDCFEPDGNFKPWARDVVQCLSSYTEWSPSKTGVHVYAKGTIPSSATHEYPDGSQFEMYNEVRYFTVTGDQYGVINNKIESRPDELAALHVVYSSPRELPAVKPARPQNVTKAQIEEALRYIPVWGDYNDWLSVLMAIHSVFPGDDGIAIAEAWSPGTPGEISRKFYSFDKTAKEGVTIATLFHIAKQGGYRPTTHNNGSQRRGTSAAGRLNTWMTQDIDNDSRRRDRLARLGSSES